MAKIGQTEGKDIAPEAEILLAAVALHASISAHNHWSAKDHVKFVFDLSDEFMKEVRQRGFKTQK